LIQKMTVAAMLRKYVPESVAVVALVSNQHVCGRQLRVDNRRALVVAHLTFGQKEDHRATGPVGDGVRHAGPTREPVV
jgi:hypothetical protein